MKIWFEGQVVVLTGASGALGRAYALEFARRGAAVVVNDVAGLDSPEGPAADAVVAAIQADGGRAVASYDSVATPEGGQAIIETALESFGTVDAVIHNAGVWRHVLYHEMTPDKLDPVLDVHLRGSFFVTQPAWSIMQEKGYGRIVLTSSGAGAFGRESGTNYVAAKAGVLGLGRALALEGARNGILANCILPIAPFGRKGPVPSRITDQLAKTGLPPSAGPELVAPMVVYLASAACTVSGEAFSAGGGRYARVFAGVAPGWLSPPDKLATAEDIGSHLDDIEDLDGFAVPDSVWGELRDIGLAYAKGASPPVLHVPARRIPLPSHLSPEAQAVLSMPPMPRFGAPPLEDLGAWRSKIAERDLAVTSMTQNNDAPIEANVEKITAEGATVFVVTPEAAPESDRRVFLDIHGGAFVLGGGELCRHSGLATAARVQSRTWTVDYRMPPDHPYPAGLDDCVAAYRALLREHRPDEIIVGGGSAGGNLAAALVLRARDEGLPLPAALLLLTPAVDLTQSGDSHHTNRGVDTVLTDPMSEARRLYAGSHDIRHPYLSPVFGDFTKGFPPTLLATGTRDLLLSDTVRMHRALRAAGVPAELHVLEAAPHGWFFGRAPEDAELSAEVLRFVDAYWPRPPASGEAAPSYSKSSR